MKSNHWFFAALALAAGLASADPIFPAADASATTAAIQAAIDAAAPSRGTVTLGAGLFEIDAQLLVTNGVTLRGQGWESTIIRQVAATPSDNTRVVTVSGGATVERVTLTGGRVSGNYNGGGGAQVDDGTISWCCITNNAADGGNNKYGGGVSFMSGKGRVDHSIVADNAVRTTAGDNARGGGIGVYMPSGPVTVDACLVRGNRTSNAAGLGQGGGIGVECMYRNFAVAVRNTTIVGNEAGTTTGKGGGVFTANDSNKKFSMLNCIVAGNTTAGAAATMALNYADGVDYCFFDVADDTLGANSLTGDPAFTDAAAGDYTLASDSPARGAGATYSGIGTDLLDVGFADPPSMGCYEAGGVAKVASPVFAPASGTAFYPTTEVTLACATAGATIYYTLDGTDPTDSSTPYTAPIPLAATTTVKARAYKADMAASAVVSATYTYQEPEVPAPPVLGAVTVAPRATKATISGAIDSVGNNGATACDVYLSLDGGAATKIAEGATASFSYVIPDLEAETTYAYALAVSNNAAPPLGASASGSFTTTAAPAGIEPVEGDPAATRRTIQDAIDAAPAGGTVVLSEGLFEIDAQLQVTNGVTLAGQGWDSTILRQTAGGQRVATVAGGATLEGVTATGGRLTANWTHGAGVLVEDGTVSWCCVSNNVSTGRNVYGGGVSLMKGSIDHSVVAFNRSGTFTSGGGGIGGFYDTSKPSLYGAVLVDACLVYGNSADALNGSGTAPAGQGGGVCFSGNFADVTIRNTTIADNSANGSGGGLYFTTPHLKLVNAIVSGNTVDSAEDDLSGTPADGSSNNLVGGDPAFVDAAGGDYRLSASSPALSAGATYAGIGLDLDGADFLDPPSIGCYQSGGSAKVAPPVFAPASGTTFYGASLAVTITCTTAGARIRYTLDGSDPTEQSALYEGPIALAASATVKARAFKEDMTASVVVTAAYAHRNAPEGSVLPVDGDPAATRAAIQAAIDAAAPTAGTVVLAEGLFEIDEQLMVTNGVTLVGQGWTNTVLRQTTTGKQSRCATLRDGSRLEGVTLTGGFVAGKWVSGAGALVEDGSISWCCISNNVAGVSAFDPVYDHVNNVYGAGVSIRRGSVDHTVFAFNEARASAGASHGGGLGVYGPTGDVLVDACLFYGNRAPQGNGGAIAGVFWNGINPYVLTVRNTTIAGNEASAEGGGVYVSQNGVRSTYDLALVNTILADNVSGLGDPNLAFHEGDTYRAGYAAQSGYNLFANGTEALGDGSQALAGSGAAWFVDPENGDYGLELDCPAVEGGESYEGLGLDLGGIEFCDPPSIGAYEYADRAARPVFDPESGAEFVGSTNVTIACGTAGATIHYTLDGSRPTASSPVYTGAIAITTRTTIKARAYAEGVGPSAIATAIFSDGTIPLEPIELGEPVARPGRDFNGSTVTVPFTGDVPEGAELSARITIGGVDYAGSVDPENQVVTLVVPATAVTAGNAYEATITLVVGDEEYTRTTVLEQGRRVLDEETAWIHETAETFGSTGAWTGDGAAVAAGAIAVSNATFTAATAAPADAVVTITSTFSFGSASDDAFETSSRAGITVVPVDGVSRYAVLTAAGASTNLSVVATTDSPVTVMVVMDCLAGKVSYSVDGMSLGTFAMAEKEGGVSTMRYDGATDVEALDGTYLLDWLDTNVAQAGDTEYPTVEEAVKSGKEPVQLLWDATWDPTTPGEYVITTNGHDLEIGGDLDSKVADNGDGTITVTVTDGTVHVRASSIAVGAATVRVGVEGIKAGCWYALEKTTDLARPFVLDEETWASASDLLAGTGELEIALAEDEPCAFYQIRESETPPAP